MEICLLDLREEWEEWVSSMRIDILRKIAQEASEEDTGVDLSEATVMSEQEEEAEFGGISDDEARLLGSALKAASDGISKGISQDLASTQDAGSIFGLIEELVVAPLTLSSPGRSLERNIKNTGGLTTSNEDINNGAMKALQEKIIAPSIRLFSSNFEALIKVLNKLSSKLPSLTLTPLNNITNIEAMAIELKAKDFSETSFSSESPYKIILKQVIPILREKFDAVASFDEALGPGSKIDHVGIVQEFYEGMDDESDAEELVHFYRAIMEWKGVLEAFGGAEPASLRGASSPSQQPSSGKSEGDESEEERDEDEVQGADEDGSIAAEPDQEVSLDDIFIEAIRPGQYVYVDPNDPRSLNINYEALNQESTPVVKIFLSGTGADRVNSSGSGEQYLQKLMERGDVSIPNTISMSDILYNVSRETVSGGAEITMYLKPDMISNMLRFSRGRAEVLTFVTRRGDVSLYAERSSEVREIRRAASLATTSYYEALSPSGESVSFSVADLVISGGTLKDSSGKKFKPSKISGKSLASKVNSKNYGKVKKK